MVLSSGSYLLILWFVQVVVSHKVIQIKMTCDNKQGNDARQVKNNITTESNEKPIASNTEPLNAALLPEQVLKNQTEEQSIWTLQTRRILEYHNQGRRTLILMRGIPGSGKSFLAKTLVQVMCPDMDSKTFIFATDDFYMRNGKYEFNYSLAPAAHLNNQNRVREACNLGVSPIFVDAININISRTKPFLESGVSNGYTIEVLEPNTPWAKDAEELATRNSHGVKISTIRRWLSQLHTVDGDYLIRSFGLCYPEAKVPPVRRNFPPIPDPPQDPSYNVNVQETFHHVPANEPQITKIVK